VFCWGFSAIRGNSGTVEYQARPVIPVGLESGVLQIGAGGSHACASKSDGLWCWGANERGQLGTGDTIYRAEPRQVQGLTGTIRAFATGGVSFRGATCAVDGAGLKCWGDNSYRQIGIPVPEFEPLPLGLAPWQAD
jgi:hypothetical protein